MSRENADKELKAELDAMNKLSALLEKLPLNSRKRVVDWAKKALVEDELEILGAAEMAQLDAHQMKLKEQAKRLGVDPRNLLHAYSALREREGVAPIEVRKTIEEAEKAVQDA